MPFALNMVNKLGAKFEKADFSNKNYDTFQKKELMVESSKFKEEMKVSELIIGITAYITLMNNFKHDIDWKTIENVVESDFLENIL